MSLGSESRGPVEENFAKIRRFSNRVIGPARIAFCDYRWVVPSRSPVVRPGPKVYPARTLVEAS
jgi:hypothetical protein